MGKNWAAIAALRCVCMWIVMGLGERANDGRVGG